MLPSMLTHTRKETPARTSARPSAPHRSLLFDIRSHEELQQRLSLLAARHSVSFGTPRLLGSRLRRRLLPQAVSPRHLDATRPGDAPESDDTLSCGAAEASSGEAGVSPVVPVWLWDGSAADLRSRAPEVLNGFVYPLAASGRPYCVAFPFDSEELSARPLEVEQRHLLDLEDISALLASVAPPSLAPPAVAATVLDGLDPDQHAAALHGGGPARVLAAAGSGKTKTMVARIAALVARGVPPRSILVMAFNAEAALQLEERLSAAGVPTTRRVRADADGVHCATFNAFGYRFQQDVLGGVPAVSADGAAQERLLRRVLTGDDDPGAWDPYNAVLTDHAGQLAGALTSWRAELRPPTTAHRPAVERYQKLQAAQSVQTFDDQVIATVCALLAYPDHRRLLQSIYRYVLVDEFQDVNPSQQALLDILSRPWRNLFVVGDDDQLIYGWRSAHVGSIVDFGADLPPAPYTAYYTLPTNYRCSQEVVARAEQLVVNNQRRAGKSMRARASAPPGAVLFASAATTADRCREIAAFLAVERLRLGCRWSDLALLARYRAQLDGLRPGFAQYGIPLGAPKAAVSLDAACAAELDRHLQAALRDGRLRGLPATALLEEIAGAMGVLDDAGVGVLDAARLLACDHAKPAGLAAAWRRLTGAPSSATPDPTPDPSRDGAAGGAAGDTRDDTPGAPADPSSRTGLFQTQAPSDGVTMATIHSTKGREYASVVIVDFAPALGPLSPEELEEERRVLYVALTRAKHAALLTVDPGGRSRRGAGESVGRHGGEDGNSTACHPFMQELGRPPQRRGIRALRRELGEYRAQLEARAADLPPALRALVTGPSPAAADQGLMNPGLAEAASRYLRLRSQLLEARLFAPASPAARLLEAIR